MSEMRAQARSREYPVTVTVDDSDWPTHAVARMRWRDDELYGVGQIRPGELFSDHASERLAVSRALSDLAGRIRANTGT